MANNYAWINKCVLENQMVEIFRVFSGYIFSTGIVRVI